jgi:hypothetical protein
MKAWELMSQDCAVILEFGIWNMEFEIEFDYRVFLSLVELYFVRHSPPIYPIVSIVLTPVR